MKHFLLILSSACLVVFVVVSRDAIASSLHANYANLSLLRLSPVALAECALRCPQGSYQLLPQTHQISVIEIPNAAGEHFVEQLSVARFAFFAGQLTQAQALLSLADAELCKSRLDCLLIQADLYRLMGDRVSFEKSLQAIDGIIGFLRRRGDSFLQAGDLDSAIGDYLTAVSISPDSAVYYRLGEAYSQQANLETSLHHYLRAIELDRFVNLRGDRIIASLASAHAKAGAILRTQWNLKQAKSHLEAAVLADGTPSQAYLDLADIYSGTGDSLLAEQILQEGIDQSPTDQLYLRLGLLYKEVGREDEAVRVWYEGLDHEQKDGYRNWLHFGVAVHHSNRAEWYRAIEHYEAGLTLNPDHPSYFSLWYRLAIAYLAVNDYDNAERAVRYALKLAPEDQASQDLLHEIEEKQR